MLEPIFNTAPAASKNDAQFKVVKINLKQSSCFINQNP